jgi:hypothetical protein
VSVEGFRYLFDDRCFAVLPRLCEPAHAPARMGEDVIVAAMERRRGFTRQSAGFMLFDLLDRKFWPLSYGFWILQVTSVFGDHPTYGG